MCEFCENPTKWNTDDYSLVPNRNLSDGIMQAEDNTYQIGVFNSYFDFWEVMDIDHCPICGRKLVEEMKETILYISKSEQDIRSFLKYLQSKLKAEQKECTLDEEHDILKVPKYYDIVGKSVHGNMLGAGYGYCKYYCFSEAYDRNKYSNAENENLKNILMHTREGAERISGLDILCMLGLV